MCYNCLTFTMIRWTLSGTESNARYSEEKLNELGLQLRKVGCVSLDVTRSEDGKNICAYCWFESDAACIAATVPARIALETAFPGFLPSLSKILRISYGHFCAPGSTLHTI